MNRSENYYFGQGKVSLGIRQANTAVNMRWVGDVDRLDIAFTSESQKKTISTRGKTGISEKYIIHHECLVSINFYEFSAENIGLAIFGQPIDFATQTEQEVIPAGIVIYGRYVMQHQNIWDVYIDGLTEGKDFMVDSLWGAVEFLRVPPVQPATVRYKHATNSSIPILTQAPAEVMLRYEGVNLAERMRPALVELYRVQFDPASALSMINNGDGLGSFTLSGDVLLDTSRSMNDALGQYGRYVVPGDIDLSAATKLRLMTTTAAAGGSITTINPERE